MESYFDCCGMCVHCNLYEKYDSYSDKFKCTERGYWVKPTEEKCRYFENDSKRTYKDIDFAREHVNGLGSR